MRCSLGIIAIDLTAGNLEGAGALQERENLGEKTGGLEGSERPISSTWKMDPVSLKGTGLGPQKCMSYLFRR